MIKKLDAQTLKDLYEREMKDTFPRAELKPLKAMLRMQGRRPLRCARILRR